MSEEIAEQIPPQPKPPRRATTIRVTLELVGGPNHVGFKAWMTSNGADPVLVGGERGARLASLESHDDCQRIWDLVLEPIRKQIRESWTEQRLMMLLPYELNGGPKMIVETPATREPIAQEDSMGEPGK